jgi:tetratricopeptide (TPR) repeat protein
VKLEPQKRGNAQMKNTLTLFSAILLLLSASPFYGQDTARISATWQVVKYDISATLPQAEGDRSLSARTSLQVRNISGRPAASLTLRISPAAEVTAVSINGSTADFTKSQEKVGNADLQRIAIRVPSVGTGGELTAVIDYKLVLADNSGVGAVTGVGSQFLPMSFWYPTPNSWFFARGADYAPIGLKLTAPSGQTVIAPGVENAGGFTTELFLQPFFVTGSWDRMDSQGAAVYVPKGSAGEPAARAGELAALAVEARTFAQNLLGPAPSVPIRIVGVRRGAGFSSGGTVLVDDAVFRRDKIDSITALSLAEAMVRLWLGDAALITDDSGGVIREGLARHLATQFIEQKYGPEIADTERMRHRLAYAAISRRDAPLSSVAPLDDYYFAAVANKGSMFWRMLERKVGRQEFFEVIRARIKAGTITMADLRSAFSQQKPYLDYMLDDVTDMNLQAGLPQKGAGEVKVAVRNTGGTDVTVNVAAMLANGERMTAPATIRAKSFGEVVFKTAQNVTRVEIDPEKLYPQSDYSDDVAPSESTDSDLLLAVKRDFDRQRFSEAERTARAVLGKYPRYDDVRVLFARSLLAQNKVTEAEAEFRAVLNEKLPTARSIAWAYVGLAETASKTGRGEEAVRNAERAILAGAEYGASLSARNTRNRHRAASEVNDEIKSFFARFDQAAISNRKTEVEALAVQGDVNRFVGGITGQATEWKTEVRHADQLDANTLLVETNLSVKLLTREPESGMAVFRMTRTPSGWRLSGVEIFEVR